MGNKTDLIPYHQELWLGRRNEHGDKLPQLEIIRINARKKSGNHEHIGFRTISHLERQENH
jgi:hypothetical protein